MWHNLKDADELRLYGRAKDFFNLQTAQNLATTSSQARELHWLRSTSNCCNWDSAWEKDVKACPGKTIVPLHRKHVFAQIKPSTNIRIDLGMALGDRKTPRRLINTGGFEKRDRITHRIEITKATDINEDVQRWLKLAYDLGK